MLGRSAHGLTARPAVAKPSSSCHLRDSIRCHIAAGEVVPAVQQDASQPEPPPTFAPDDLVLEEGQLSTVSRDQPPHGDDAFRCTGCTDVACQVRT